MGLLSKLLGKQNVPGNTQSICPYCGARLEKRPQRKKKCTSCGYFIYVRTRPSDRKKVLATEEQAQAIDEEWMKINGTYDAHREEQIRFEQKKRELSERFGTEASDYDVQWSLLNESAIQHAQQMNWGLYRNVRYQMAEQLRKEGREKQALLFFIEVSYLDANGPNNRGGISDPDLLKQFPMFDPEMGFQALAVARSISKLASKQSMSDDELKELYIETTSEHQARIKLPVSPHVAWKALLPDLK
jgi:ribosomal protein L37E